jgi:hypothetical protein
MPNVDNAGEQDGLFQHLSLVLILSLTWVSAITVLHLSQPLNDASWEANMDSNIPETSYYRNWKVILSWGISVVCINNKVGKGSQQHN